MKVIESTSAPTRIQFAQRPSSSLWTASCILVSIAMCLGVGGGLLFAQFLQLAVEGASRDTEVLRGLGHVALALFERLQHEALLGGVQIEMLPSRKRVLRRWQPAHAIRPAPTLPYCGRQI